MADLTAIILTRNEEDNLAACLDSLAGFAARMVVVDSGSTDGTVAIARAHGAEVVEHAFTYYAAQFNWAIGHIGAETEWLLRIDADERFTPALCSECETLLREAPHGVNGVSMEAEYYFLGRLLRHGGSKRRKIMIFRRGHGGIEDRKRDAHTVLTDGGYVRTKQRFIHCDCKDLGDYIARCNWYAIREEQDYLAYRNGADETVNTDAALQRTRRKKFGLYYRAPMFLRAWLWFVYKYVFCGGFLDGVPGLVYHFLECYWYRFLVDARLYERRVCGGGDDVLTAFGEEARR